MLLGSKYESRAIGRRIQKMAVFFKSLNDGKQTKWFQLAKKVAICRGSLAWLGRQTHNLEFDRGKRLQPEVAGSKLEKSENPAPGTTSNIFNMRLWNLIKHLL